MQNNTHVSGANSVSIHSGGDTNLIGANVKGASISADVGGDLNVASVQDTTTSAVRQQSMSAGASISQGGGSASASVSGGNARGSYAGVNEQSGIQAGSGGFEINVKGNTTLTGAYLASDADASKNSLSTDTLTSTDIENHSSLDASSFGISAGGGVGSTGQATGPASVSGAGGIVPMLPQNDSDDSRATTKSAISESAIHITDQANQKQDITSIRRETSDLNGTLSEAPDLSTLLAKQADMMQAAQAAGQVVAQGIGAYANAQMEAALEAGDTASAQAWAEGGTSRVLAHIAGGALMGGLGGGSLGGAMQGAAGAGVSASLAGKLNSLADSIGDATGSMTLGNTVSNVLAGMGGGLAGGGTGAFMASNADLYNRATTNSDGTGGTGSQMLDRFADWAKWTYGDIPGTVSNWGNQSVQHMNADAQAKMSEPASDLIAQGIANGVNAVAGTGGGKPPTASPGTVLVDSKALSAVSTLGYEPEKLPSNTLISSRKNANEAPNPNNPAPQPREPASASAEIFSSIFGENGELPAGIDGRGKPISMEASDNPNVTAEQFAKAAFNSQTPVKVMNNITGEGSWVAILPDGTAVTYRPAGQASTATRSTTATVEVSSPSIRNINNGKAAKFKFPSK
ncbi:hemagglutinin repeat-containing protein [Pararobbsia silviterrae]|nr:hemagglutinin repeat-containing protein [Pararobbsia silviterrae]